MSFHHHQARSSSEDDYCSYVTKLERKTSIVEGPHFPQLQTVFKHKELEFHEEEKPHHGLFGRPRAQKEWFEEETCEISEKTYGDDVESVRHKESVTLKTS